MAKEKSILTVHQKRVLDLISKEKYFTDRFYFTGGTVLAEFYLKHRFSEDLDFFSEKQEVNAVPITRFFQNNAKRLKISRFDTRRVLGLYTFFLTFADGSVLKVDFNYYPFLRAGRGFKYNKLDINSLYDIAIDKVHTVVMKPRARDYIDLFFILRQENFKFNDLLLQAKAKFDWDITALELGARFMEAAETSDYPKMRKKIDHREWKNFFLNEARKLKSQIFEE